jgi:hypothetical protein
MVREDVTLDNIRDGVNNAVLLSQVKINAGKNNRQTMTTKGA